jgi:hypothetical protein
VDTFDWWESRWVPTSFSTAPVSVESGPDSDVAAVRAYAELGAQWVAAVRARVEVTGIVCEVDGSDIDEQTRARFSQLRDDAVRTYSRHADCDEEKAKREVASLQAHLGHLEDKTAWFRESADLRRKAIDECLQYSVFRAKVSSSAAQLAWENFRGSQLAVEKTLRNNSFERANRRESCYILMRGLLPQFLNAWAAWAARHEA